MSIQAALRPGSVVLAMFISAVVGTSVGKQTVQPQSIRQYLSERQRFFVNYHQDFLNFAESLMGEAFEYQIAYNLGTVASFNQERIDAAKVLLDIYYGMTCEKDRLLVKSHLKTQLLYDVQRIDLDIKQVNNELSGTKFPGVSQTALRMKDDLRNVRAKLNTVRASLE